MASKEPRATTSGMRWRIVWRQDGEKQQQTYDHEGAADAFRRRVEAYGNRWPPGEDPRVQRRAGKLTFGEWAEVAIANRTRASDRAKADYRRDVERHMADLVNVALTDIGDEHVARWLERLTTAARSDANAEPLSTKTIRNIHGFASSLYADALRQRPPLVDVNPFEGKMPEGAAVHIEEMVFLTPPEFAVVHGHILDERDYPRLMWLLGGTGARFGEATALQVDDVHLFGKRKAVSITKAWKRTGPRTWKIGEPKTPRARRLVPIGEELVDQLIPLVAGRHGKELLFPGAGGGQLPHTEVYKRGWAPAVARANVCIACLPTRLNKRGAPARYPEPCQHAGVLGKVPRIHDIRHSHISWLIAAGVPLPAISRRVGHSSIQITIDRYGHMDPSLDDAVNIATDEALALLTSRLTPLPD